MAANFVKLLYDALLIQTNEVNKKALFSFFTLISLLFFGWHTILFSGTPTRPGKDFALFIAVNSYDNNSWHDLTNPVRDAEAVAEELRSRYGFQTEILRDPGQEAILQKLREYSERTYPEDGQLFIFFSGHGSYDDATTIGFLIPRDGKPSAEDPEGLSWISHSVLRDRISAIPCKHILVLIDACYSGTFDRQIAIDRAEEQVEVFVAQGLRYQSRLYLTSGGKVRTPEGTEHSPFTNGLLSAFRLDENGLITFTELAAQMVFVEPQPRYGYFEGNEAGGSFYFIGERAHIPNQDGNWRRPSPDRGEDEGNSSFVRDPSGNTYRTIRLANQLWTAQNLNYQTRSGSWCYEGNFDNCQRFGRLYTWEEAKNVCATLGAGWRLPTENDWRTLARQFGGIDDDAVDSGAAAVRALMKRGASGFNADPGGRRKHDGSFEYVGNVGYYWSATASENNGREYYGVFEFNNAKLRRIYYPKTLGWGFSCRCVHN